MVDYVLSADGYLMQAVSVSGSPHRGDVDHRGCYMNADSCSPSEKKITLNAPLFICTKDFSQSFQHISLNHTTLSFH